jgi:hypothetical protein
MLDPIEPKRTWREVAWEIMHERDPHRLILLVKELNDALELEFPALSSGKDGVLSIDEATQKAMLPKSDVN